MTVEVTGMSCVYREPHSSLSEFNRKLRMLTQSVTCLLSLHTHTHTRPHPHTHTHTPTPSFCSPPKTLFFWGRKTWRNSCLLGSRDLSCCRQASIIFLPLSSLFKGEGVYFPHSFSQVPVPQLMQKIPKWHFSSIPIWFYFKKKKLSYPTVYLNYSFQLQLIHSFTVYVETLEQNKYQKKALLPHS